MDTTFQYIPYHLEIVRSGIPFPYDSVDPQLSSPWLHPEGVCPEHAEPWHPSPCGEVWVPWLETLLERWIPPISICICTFIQTYNILYMRMSYSG